MRTDKEIKEIVSFAKKCLKDEGYSKELIAFVFSTYDLKTFIGESVMTRLEIATHFLSHTREIHLASTKF